MRGRITTEVSTLPTPHHRLRRSLPPRGSLNKLFPRQPTSRTRCHFERSREIPRGRNGNNRTRIPEILARRGTLPSVAETTVSPSGRFPRSLRSLGMTYYKGCARRLIVFIRFNPNRTPVPPCHCERRRSRSVAISWKRKAAHVPAPAKCPRWLIVERERSENNRTLTKCLSRWGFLHCVRVKTLTPVEMTS